jgi:hypothetical protein
VQFHTKHADAQSSQIKARKHVVLASLDVKLEQVDALVPASAISEGSVLPVFVTRRSVPYRFAAESDPECGSTAPYMVRGPPWGASATS